MIKDMIKLGTFLLVACAIAAAALSITYVSTAERIEVQKTAQINTALSKECLLGSSKVKQMAGDHYVGYDSKGNVMGHAYRVAPKGYGGTIDMIVGIDTKGRVIGVKILSMKETPGLGAKAVEPKFLGQFLGKTSESRLKAKKDVDAITGATITSQAVADGIKEALNKFSSK